MTVVRVARPPCRHRWTPWHQAGYFDTTLRRDCTKCKLIQTKRPPRWALPREPAPSSPT